MDIFKAYDIRGVYPTELNADTAFELGRSIATAYPERKIFVNNDNRGGSIAIRSSFTLGLVHSGATVYELNMGPVCVPAFASFNERGYGVCISASHNPAEYTGILSFLNGTTITPEKIKKIFDSKGFSKKTGKTIPYHYDDKYIKYITKGIRNVGLKIGVDCMGGSGTFIVPECLELAGLDARMMNDKPSENFYGKIPEPSKENSKELSDIVKKEKLDFGIQLDGDCDRIIFIDENGDFVDPVTAALIFIKFMKIKNSVVNVACPSIIERYSKVKYTRVGGPFMEPYLKKTCDFGFEVSSHFYFGKYYPFSDGILASLLMSRILKKWGKSMSELVNTFPELYYGLSTAKFNTEEERTGKMAEISYKISKLGKTIKIDGIKVMLNDGFILFRESNTEPLIRAYYEGKDRRSYERIKRMVEDILE